MASSELIAEINRTIDTYENLTGGFAANTHLMIQNRGHVGALSRLVQSADLQTGFRLLRDRGELERTFEAVIVRFSNDFQPQVVQAAQ